MKYLLDTNILINFFKKEPKTTFFVEDKQSYISFVSIGELIQGARNNSEKKYLLNFISQMSVDYANPSIAKNACEILSDYYLSHHTTFFDTLIAATALENQSILVTYNLKHFRPIKNLKIISP